MVVVPSINMELLINTSNAKTIEVALLKDCKVIKSLIDQNRFGSQALLPLIKKLLKDEGLEIGDIVKIKLATGPGSFTGLKVGAAVANSLAFSLGIRVNGKEIETEINY